MIRIAVALVMFLLLAGCDNWVGQRFYSAKEAINPFRPGTYQVIDASGKKQILRWDGHHVYQNKKRRPVKDERDLRNVVVVPFFIDRRRIYIVQAKMTSGALYGFLEQRGDDYVINIPSCKLTYDIAVGAGAIPREPSHEENAEKSTGDRPSFRNTRNGFDDGKTDLPNAESERNCVFTTRAGLEKAAQRYIRERQLIGTIRIKRIAD